MLDTKSIFRDIEESRPPDSAVDREAREFGRRAGKLKLQGIIDDASDNSEIIKKIMNPSLHWVRKNKIPSGGGRF